MSEAIHVKSIQDLFEKPVAYITPFPVMHSGWECDATGYEVILVGDKIRGEVKIVFTSHGKPYVADKETVHQKLKEYSKASSDLEWAMIRAGMEDKNDT